MFVAVTSKDALVLQDKRLVFLLQQTDEYVESLTGLVRQHQQTEKKRKREERKMQKQDEKGIFVRKHVMTCHVTCHDVARSPKSKDATDLYYEYRV